jgi:hypothetical protein
MRYNLACDLWPEYSNKITDIERIERTAAQALGKVKVSNIVDSEATYDDVPMVESGRSWDWRAGS